MPMLNVSSFHIAVLRSSDSYGLASGAMKAGATGRRNDGSLESGSLSLGLLPDQAVLP
jgi:hypothetical protein